MDEKNLEKNTSLESNQNNENISNTDDIHSPSNENNNSNKREELIEELRSQQNFPFAVIGGVLAAVFGAILWAAITVATEYQIGYMAIAVGLIVGFTVRFFGAGVDMKFGILGAILSLFGCLLGNLFSQIGFIANAYSYAYLEVFSYLDFSSIIDVMVESFSPMDILFYGIAIYEGYRFSFYQETEHLINNVNSIGNKLRMPLAIVATIILIVIYFVLKLGYSGAKINTYDSGEIMSEGNIKNGKYDGPWIFYYENGKILSEGNFYNNLRDGDWQWYSENGNLERTGSYIKGLENGVWISYYESGSVADSVAYKDGRLNGKYIAKYENGNIYQVGNYKRDKGDGLWRTYHENGQLWSAGEMKDGEYIEDWIFYFENGNVQEELHYEAADKVLIRNSWDSKGNQIVKDGSGYYAVYSEDNKTLLSSGEVKNGEKVGIWKSYFLDGKLNEEGLYDNNTYKTINMWNRKGEQTVKDGNGKYILYWENDSVYMTGDIKNGLKDGILYTYNVVGELLNESEYFNGELHGKIKSYFNSDQIAFEGEYLNGIKQGKWNWYNEDGTLSSTVQYKDDKKEGTQLFYDITGNLVKKEEYRNGELLDAKIVNQ